MQYKNHKVFLLAETVLGPEVESFLEHNGVTGWLNDIDRSEITDTEILIELAGRRCYKSFETEDSPVSEQNPNLTKVRKGTANYIKHLLKLRHGSVFEHASVTIALEDVSRVVTHEVVRHRLCSFSQESLRFVRPTSLNMYFPNVFEDLPQEKREALEAVFSRTVESLEEVQKRLVELLGLDESVHIFSQKKKLQSAMRRLMPIGMLTGIIVTANHRQWRHMIELRTSTGAEEEIAAVFLTIAKLLQTRFPHVYQDLVILNDTVTFQSGRI